MRLRTLKSNALLAGKRVLIRIDANVPLVRGRVEEGPHGRIAQAAVDIEWLRQHGARTIVVTHFGRPMGKRISAYSVRPIAKRLSELLNQKVQVARGVVGPEVERVVEAMQDGDVLLLENIRFDAREEENSPSLARALAALADLYIDDAFAVAHRAHASVDAITSELPSYAGPLLVREVETLSKAIDRPRKPFVVAMGGLKMADKLPVLKNLLSQTDAVLIGGALATAFLKAKGYEVGISVYDKAGVEMAAELLRMGSGKIRLPVDVVVAKALRKGARGRIVAVDAVGPKEAIVDIGPATLAMYADDVKRAKTIVWNGPFGYTEAPAFAAGTKRLAQFIAGRTGKALTIVGGGDTVPLIESLGLADRFTLLSTGGGAMLEFLAGNALPGIEVLKN